MGSPSTFTLVNFTTGPYLVSYISGSGNTNTAGVQISTPLIVQVTDQNGIGVAAGFTVVWSTTAGTGSVSAPTSNTNASGFAQIFMTPSSGANTVQASSNTLFGSPVSFTETGSGQTVSVSGIWLGNLILKGTVILK